jgi:cytochrome c oxidase subunit 3
MAHAPAIPAETANAHGEPARTPAQAPRTTPGKFAMWLFLATEIMFFTGLIGSYIVLRSGSPPGAFSNLYPPATDLRGLEEYRGVVLNDVGPQHHQVAEIVEHATGLHPVDVEHLIHQTPTVIQAHLTPAAAEDLRTKLERAGGKANVEGLEQYNWPKPYHTLTNPLSIDLTAINTFILICSSVTMVLALAAIQRGNKAGLIRYLAATVLIGSTFLGIQVYEYYQLSTGHHYSVGISPSGHFRPSVSLFGSCFYTMTGFHGAHVFGGVILLSCILIGSLMGKFTQRHHSAVELAGLYWHFVDLVWIILFTVVYLI